jgi:hypothetical protein
LTRYILLTHQKLTIQSEEERFTMNPDDSEKQFPLPDLKKAPRISDSEYDTLPILDTAAIPTTIGHDAILESQVAESETCLPPRMSTARMVVLAAGMMMTYFVGVSIGKEGADGRLLRLLR